MAEESIVKDNLKWVNMFKIRYSYGKTGNDNLGDTRFPYLYNLETLWERDNSGNVVSGNKPVGGYQFADFGYDRYYGGMRYTSVASTNVSWEVATKQDLGIDFSFLTTNCRDLLTISMNVEKVFIWSVSICLGLLH